ncbi:MAG: OmpA family protein [Methylotenera sp.]|nr:OmpA family protein [Methylotenera sp.]
MKKNIINLAVAATLTLTAFSAAAEDMYRGAWYAVPGVSLMQDDSTVDNKRFGAGAFLKLGKELSDSFDVQGGVTYDNSGIYKQGTLGLDALYMFSRSNFRPFLLAGAGASGSKLDYAVKGTSGGMWSPMVNVGLGAQYLINDTFGLQADLREVWSRTRDLNGTVPVNAIGKTTVNNTLLNLGGIMRFGAPAAAPVIAAAPVAEPAPYVAPEPAPAPVVEPAPAPAPVVCKPTDETITVGAEKLFGFNKAALKADGKAALDEAAAKIKANPEIKAVIVTGHTDRIGTDAYNQKLSEKRAKQVADYLVAQGVDSALITAEGKGESEPVVQCTGNKATAKLVSCLQPNRRVEIRAEGTKQVGCN